MYLGGSDIFFTRAVRFMRMAKFPKCGKKISAEGSVSVITILFLILPRSNYITTSFRLWGRKMSKMLFLHNFETNQN